MAELAPEVKQTRLVPPKKAPHRAHFAWCWRSSRSWPLPASILWRYLNTYETTDDAQIDGHINAISGRITGNVIEVLAEDEQVVKAGDVLVRHRSARL